MDFDYFVYGGRVYFKKWCIECFDFLLILNLCDVKFKVILFIYCGIRRFYFMKCWIWLMFFVILFVFVVVVMIVL